MRRRTRSRSAAAALLRSQLVQTASRPLTERADVLAVNERGVPPGSGVDVEELALSIQRTSGNAAAARLLQRQSTPTVSDRDFSEARARHASDAEAKKRGRALNRPNKDEGGYEPEKDPIEEKIDEVIGDPEKRMKALAKYKIPTDAEDLAKEDEKYKWERDLESATAKVKEYLDYFDKGLEFMEKTGEYVPFEPAAEGLSHVHEVLQSKVDVAHKWVKKVDELREWVASIGRVAEATRAWDPHSSPDQYRAQAKKWVHELRRFTKASAPYVQWLKDHAVDLAFEGSEAAAEAAVVLPLVFVQFEAGLKLLQQGIENEDAYFKRLDRIMSEIDFGSGAAPKAEPPPPPGGWESRDELQQRLKRMEDYQLHQAMRGQHDDQERAKRDAFETTAFPKLYRQARGKLKAQILADLRAQKEGADKWWDCLADDSDAADKCDPEEHDPESATGGCFYDEQAGIYVYPKVDQATPDQLAEEIAQFKDLAATQPCPYFQHVYEMAARAAGVKLGP